MLSLECTVDASSLINLNNSSVLKLVVQYITPPPVIPYSVQVECKGKLRTIIEELQQTGSVTFTEHSDSDAILQFMEAHSLGPGESESILIASCSLSNFVADDRKARRIARSILGEKRVLGTARLLEKLVQSGDLTCGDAESSYLLMKDSGGFLPDLTHTFFCPQ